MGFYFCGIGLDDRRTKGGGGWGKWRDYGSKMGEGLVWVMHAIFGIIETRGNVLRGNECDADARNVWPIVASRYTEHSPECVKCDGKKNKTMQKRGVGWGCMHWVDEVNKGGMNLTEPMRDARVGGNAIREFEASE